LRDQGHPVRGRAAGGSLQLVLEAFAPLGVTGEGLGQFEIVALNVAPDADIAAVKRLLRDGERDGWREYEEGCAGGAWLATGRD
jgi:hypothetical protein